MTIDCPFCGRRELHEYHFHTAFSPLHRDGIAAVYERDNGLDHSHEYWHHRHGCQAWLVVERNPSNGEVLAVSMLRG